MKKINVYKIFLIIALLLFIISLYLVAIGSIEIAGIPLISFFCFLAIGFSGFKATKGYVFTAFLFAGIVLSFYYPHYFIAVNDFKLTNLIVPLIQIIMFGMGISMSIKDFATVFKSPKAVLVGVSAQLCVMPIVRYILAKMSGFPPEIAAGIVLIGASPSGVASNVIA